MTFATGLLLGAVVGFVVATRLARRTPGDSIVGGGNGIPIVIAALALVVAAVALARSDGQQQAAAPTTPATSTTGPATTTTVPATTAPASVIVPNVVGQERGVAVAALEKLGLRASIDTLSLANVPSGFVLSQNPITASRVTPGSTVSLVVSSAT